MALPLRGRGMFAGKSSSEEYLRRKHEETLREDEAMTHTQSDRKVAQRPSALGKYAFVPGGSEEFALEKQKEIKREDSKCE